MDDGSIWRCLLSSLQKPPSGAAAAAGIDAGSIIIYFILIILLILGGAYFAGAEISLASCNRVRMKANAEDGDKKAQYVMYILNNFDNALSTILIGNNVMHIACASAATLITMKLCRGNPKFMSAALAISTAVITVIVFLFAEMIPKYYAKAFNERFALKIGRSLYILMKILTPLAFIFTAIGKFFGKIFRKKKREEPAVTEDDLVDMIESFKDDREEDKETEASTAELMVNALQFGAKTAGSAKTSWDSVEKLYTSMEISEIYEIVRASSHSRFPMLNAKGRIIGVLNIRPFLKAYMKDGENTELIDIIDTPLFIRPEMPVDELLSRMSKSKIHLAFITEQGEITGIITIEDILEELVGEIFDESDSDQENKISGKTKRAEKGRAGSGAAGGKRTSEVKA